MPLAKKLIVGLSVIGALACPLIASRAAYAQQMVDATCGDCHPVQRGEFNHSIHAPARVLCQSCHGGADFYTMQEDTLATWQQALARAGQGTRPADDKRFEHEEGFTGKPSRKDIPELCGKCHSNVEMMNPYGLPTDQLAQYRISHHGQALYNRGDERVAVCTDCHKTHDIVAPNDPGSPVYALNIPGTCGRCHSDPQVMAGLEINLDVVEQYKQSVHGRGLLEGGDTGMPHCATCHGSHSAIPPGYSEIGHVCGRCHQQEEQRFLESLHGGFEHFPRCIGCHSESLALHDHRILRLTVPPADLERLYERVQAERPDLPIDDPKLQQAFAEAREPKVRLESFCRRCHNPDTQIGHRSLLEQTDERAALLGAELDRLVRETEYRYSATAARVDRAGQGVVLVSEEALQVEQLRTDVVALRPLQHTLDLEKVQEATKNLNAVAGEINASLDAKLRGIAWRHWTLIPMWGFIVLFSSVLWIKFKRLKKAMVIPWPQK